MEDLEFRVWDKRISEWQNHLLKVSFLGCLFFSHPYVAPECYEIMQYVGRKDKKEKKIFKGDIVNGIMAAGGGMQSKPGKETLFEVIGFNTEHGYVYSLRTLRKIPDLYRTFPHFRNCEIIGNKFQNPELLEEK